LKFYVTSVHVFRQFVTDNPYPQLYTLNMQTKFTSEFFFAVINANVLQCVNTDIKGIVSRDSVSTETMGI
jgi:hypothetical protein